MAGPALPEIISRLHGNPPLRWLVLAGPALDSAFKEMVRACASGHGIGLTRGLRSRNSTDGVVARQTRLPHGDPRVRRPSGPGAGPSRHGRREPGEPHRRRHRGLGATQGQLLGSVPAKVVKNAVCDVLVVQTSALDEERMFAAGDPAEAAGDGARPATGTDSDGRPPTRS